MFLYGKFICLKVDIADRYIDRSQTKREKDIRIDKSLFI